MNVISTASVSIPDAIDISHALVNGTACTKKRRNSVSLRENQTLALASGELRVCLWNLCDFGNGPNQHHWTVAKAERLGHHLVHTKASVIVLLEMANFLAPSTGNLNKTATGRKAPPPQKKVLARMEQIIRYWKANDKLVDQENNEFDFIHDPSLRTESVEDIAVAWLRYVRAGESKKPKNIKMKEATKLLVICLYKIPNYKKDDERTIARQTFMLKRVLRHIGITNRPSSSPPPAIDPTKIEDHRRKLDAALVGPLSANNYKQIRIATKSNEDVTFFYNAALLRPQDCGVDEFDTSFSISKHGTHRTGGQIRAPAWVIFEDIGNAAKTVKIYGWHAPASEWQKTDPLYTQVTDQANASKTSLVILAGDLNLQTGVEASQQRHKDTMKKLQGSWVTNDWDMLTSYRKPGAPFPLSSYRDDTLDNKAMWCQPYDKILILNKNNILNKINMTTKRDLIFANANHGRFYSDHAMITAEIIW